MFEHLDAVVRQYEELQERLSQPEVYSDASAYARCQKELSGIAPVAGAYQEYLAAGKSMASALELMEDPELAQLAREEYDEAKTRREALEQRIRLLLLPKDPNDEKNVIFEIRGGVGGEEGALFASDLYRMYAMYAEARGWKTEISNISETELGGIKEIDFVIEGEGAYSRLKYEAGGHRVQRVPVTESGGRIHTSAATVAVLPEVDEVDFRLDLNDVRIDVFRSSGAGGQKVNKTSSAIRVTHLPTGIVVECQNERSQYQNKDKALQILRAKLYEMEQAKQDASVAAQRKSQVGSGDRSDRIRTYNFPQNRVTDHRLTGEVKNFNLQHVIDGNLDEIIDALIAQDQAEKLSRQGEE
ncbi:MAG: peptide chain release factor 1 [Oscillospiraceae bacterium]|nr:peptide chain release factor 1 [Oscillospiraceae bacterium]